MFRTYREDMRARPLVSMFFSTLCFTLIGRSLDELGQTALGLHGYKVIFIRLLSFSVFFWFLWFYGLLRQFKNEYLDLVR